MKKIVSLAMVIVLITTTAIAFAIDYSAMTEAQIKEEFDAIRNELTKRGLVAEKKTVILEQADIQFYISGDLKIDKPYAWSETYNLYIPIVIINNSKSNIMMMIENVSVNGWSTSGDDDGGSTPAGKKSKAYLVFRLEDTDVESLEDFTDVEFTVRIFDSDTYKDLVYTKPITIYPAQH